MEQYTIKNLYTLEETIAADLFKDAVYPWEHDGKRKCLGC